MAQHIKGGHGGKEKMSQWFRQAKIVLIQESRQ